MEAILPQTEERPYKMRAIKNRVMAMLNYKSSILNAALFFVWYEFCYIPRNRSLYFIDKKKH